MLADPEIAGCGEPEDVGRDADSERVQPGDGVAQESSDRLAHRLRVAARVADGREVAVAREPDVVELDLVEAGLRDGDGDVDVVAPGRTRVRVQPAETTFRLPERAVAAPNRELGVR